MTLSKQDITAAAADLLNAEQSGQQIGLLSKRFPQLDMDGAYAIQAELVKQKVNAGRAITGWKIGLTSKAMQDALGIDVPDSGVLFDDMHFASGAVVPIGRFIQPRIEAEIAFVMKTDVTGNALTAQDIIDATDYVTPAIEILDTRIVRADAQTGETRKIVDTISDNAANAGIVLGEQKHTLASVDLRWVGAICSRNGDVEETGLGAGVLNDPVTSVLWLAQRLSQYGQGIKAGAVVLSGSFIRPIECPTGTYIEADYGPFGSINIRFE